jgi:hypothetical protein
MIDDEGVDATVHPGDDPADDAAFDDVGLHPWLPAFGGAAATATERDLGEFVPVPDLADVLARARAMDPTAVPADWDEFARGFEDPEHAWLPAFGAAAVASTERDVLAFAPTPDLADVLARARAMDPAAVPADWDDLADDIDDPEHPWLATFRTAAAASTDRDISRYAPVPDLADVLARARAMDPAAVPADWDDLARDDVGVVPLARKRALQHDVPDPMVGVFAAALRGQVEQGLHERQLAAIPEAPQLPRRRRVAVVAAVALMAAALVAWFAGPQLLAQLAPAPRQDDSAAQTVVPDEDVEPWSRREPRPVVPRAPVVAPTPEVTPEVVPEVVVPEPIRRPTADLDAIEREALTAWRAGDLAEAERLLLRIAKSGRSGRAELAYGDLFSIARQRRGTAGQVAMWRAYLERFPRGRFADDARGGVCRRADDAAVARTCWADYLRRHPGGAHVAEAKRWQSNP